MANKSPTYRDAVLKAGAVESLLKQYKRWGYSETVSWMIIKLYEGGLPTDSTMLGPILVPIYQLLLGDNDEAVLISACQGLYYLSVDSEERVQAMVGAGVYARLVELLHHSSRLVQSEVLNTISCLVRKANLSVEPLVSSNVLPVLMAFMSSTDDEDEQKDSCKIIFTIIEGLNEQTKTLVNHGCIRPLCASLSSNDVETIQYGLAGLAKVLKFGRTESGQSVKQMISGCVHWIASSLTQLETEVKSHESRQDELKNQIEQLKTELNSYWHSESVEDF